MAEFHLDGIPNSIPFSTLASPSFFLVVITGAVLLAIFCPVGRRMTDITVSSGLGTRRTDTRGQLVFSLSRPQPVTFDFSRRHPCSFEVTIPAGSPWSPVPTFHLQESSCIKLMTISGTTFIYYESIVRGSGSTIAPNFGYEADQSPRLYLTWNNHSHETPSTVVINANIQLYRTLCSVTQDAERYFHLGATPVWIRALYAALGWIPSYGNRAKEVLVRLALYVQLRAIFYKNDCWTHQGRIRIDRYWWTAPRWVWEFQAWTIIVISRVTLCFLYWFGWFCLGMRESYDEYTLGDEAFVDIGSGQGEEKPKPLVDADGEKRVGAAE